MKKLVLTIALLFGMLFGASAQNRSIDFLETKVWQEIVDNAKKENKLIFIDCYTDWCGPCKVLSANVFTQDKVADFYNENFVNAKFEMEKDADAIARKDQWDIKAYPTLIFVDPATETVVHRLVGAGQADWLIEGGEMAMLPSSNLQGMMDRYKNGDRSPEFLSTYLKTLKSAYMSEEQNEVATEYLDNMSVEELATPEGWLLIRDNISDPLAKPMRLMMENREKFYEIPDLGQRSVDLQLTNSIMGSVMGLVGGSTGRGAFDQQKNDELTKYLQQIDFPVAKPALYYLGTAQKVRGRDWDGVLADVNATLEKPELLGSNGRYYFSTFIESVGASGNEDIVRKAVGIIDRQIESIEGESSNAWFGKARMADSKNRLYKAIGNELAADKAKMEEEEYSEKGKAASGGRIQQAIRMN